MRIKRLLMAGVLILCGGLAYANCDEAAWVVMDIDEDALLPDPDLVDQVAGDLSDIRQFNLYFEDLHAQAVWDSGSMLVKLTADAYEEYLAGTYTGLDSLNAIYGATDMVPMSLAQWFLIQFPFCYNYFNLGEIYEPHPDLIYADPNYMTGDGNDILSDQVGLYLFRKGWGDCPAGCISEHFWLFSVENGIVLLLEHYGDSVDGWPSSVPEDLPLQPDFVLLQNVPNPFNPTTEIAFNLREPGTVTLRILDVAGREVSRLLSDTRLPAGSHRAVWNGCDASGEPLNSGVYLSRLETDAGASSVKMNLIK